MRTYLMSQKIHVHPYHMPKSERTGKTEDAEFTWRRN